MIFSVCTVGILNLETLNSMCTMECTKLTLFLGVHAQARGEC